MRIARCAALLLGFVQILICVGAGGFLLEYFTGGSVECLEGVGLTLFPGCFVSVPLGIAMWVSRSRLTAIEKVAGVLLTCGPFVGLGIVGLVI